MLKIIKTGQVTLKGRLNKMFRHNESGAYEVFDQGCPGGGFAFSVFEALLRAAVFLAGIFDCVKKDSQQRISSRPYAREASHTALGLAAKSM